MINLTELPTNELIVNYLKLCIWMIQTDAGLEGLRRIEDYEDEITARGEDLENIWAKLKEHKYDEVIFNTDNLQD